MDNIQISQRTSPAEAKYRFGTPPDLQHPVLAVNDAFFPVKECGLLLDADGNRLSFFYKANENGLVVPFQCGVVQRSILLKSEGFSLDQRLCQSLSGLFVFEIVRSLSDNSTMVVFIILNQKDGKNKTEIFISCEKRHIHLARKICELSVLAIAHRPNELVIEEHQHGF